MSRGANVFDLKNIAGRWPTWSAIALLSIATMGGSTFARAQQGTPGITQRTVFPSFNPNAPSCNAPAGLTKVLAYVQENDRDFLEGVDHGLSMAARDRGLEYRRVLVENDVGKAITQVQSLVAAKVGAMVATSPDPAAFSPALQQAIWSGAFVGTIVPPPATLLLNAPQYRTGKVHPTRLPAEGRD
jgi:ribose transport system substrate-binding protein